ncbi:hypothetical protein [Idiomarina sp.]|uniref:hypothetical protein n=1 Tax=Idiomarina sp. TaxID=1874361 RepID=UPI0025C111A6|nr:hypothetical protein [Idiomarina sp.]NQZ04535.1 hypothetical protein [Idiomarina sp.]
MSRTNQAAQQQKMAADELMRELKQAAGALSSRAKQKINDARDTELPLASLVGFANTELLECSKKLSVLDYKLAEALDKKIQQYKRIYLSADDLAFSPALYEIEKDNKGKTYAWWGKEHSLRLNLALDRSTARELRIRLANVIDDEILDGIELKVGGELVKLGIPKGSRNLVVGTIPKASDVSYSAFEFLLPYTKSPSEQNKGLDNRQLGVALSAISIS